MRLPAGALLLAFALATPARGALPETMRAGLEAAGIPEDAVGAIVMRASDGAVVLAHRADAGMQPASTLKLLTSIAALERLGPAFRGRSELRISGELRGGVLRGDVTLRGLGDVDLDWHAFERMLSSLRLHGVRDIDGNLLLDLSYFRPARSDIGTMPFDEAPEFRYNVIPDALLVNTYLLRLDIVSHGGAVRIAASPALEGVTVASELQLVERACPDWEDGWKLPAVSATLDGAVGIRLRGDFPRDCAASTAINVIDRLAFVDRLFRSLWTHMGGTFRGQAREAPAPPEARLIAEHKSRPLAEVVLDVNKHSDNPITRVVYLTLGAAAGASSLPTAERAELAIRAWLQARGIDDRGLVLENGSGLSRAERIRPDQLAAVLRAALASRWAPEFVASLPIVAVDGGMRSRLAASPAAATARIKTGTLRDVSAVAGYVKDEDGETYVVVAIVNHALADRKVARPILDTFIDYVARLSAREAAPAPGLAY